MESLISDLESLADFLEAKANGCKSKGEKARLKQRIKAVHAAAELLREQEPAPANEIKLFNGIIYYECGRCKTIIQCLDAFCHECGKPVKWYRRNQPMEKTYCGKTWEQMNAILDTMCKIEDRCCFAGEEEQTAFDIAIQCICTVMNRMKCDHDRPIEFD